MTWNCDAEGAEVPAEGSAEGSVEGSVEVSKEEGELLV